ncbi:MAG TPA: GAF domain-containing protein [Anaerolineae bacterium]|nr:GAF domain-containing protein [Anaerolineae bacterium]
MPNRPIAANEKGVILIADDSSVNRSILKRTLKQQDYTVIEAKGGREALEALNQYPIDALLLDLIMPDIDGYEVLETIKQNPILQSLPIIILSNINDADSVARCIQMGATDFLPKPFNPTLLEARLNTSLAHKKLRQTEQSFALELQIRNDELDTQKQQLENLAAITKATIQEPSWQGTLENILSITVKLTAAKFGTLIVLDDSGRVTYRVRVEEALVRGRAEKTDRIISSGLAGWVLQHKQPALVDDTREDERWLTLPDQDYEARSVLSVPILYQENVIGILTLTHADVHRFTYEQLDLLQASAPQLALSLNNAKNYEEQRQLAADQSMLYHVLAEVSLSQDIAEILEKAAQQMITRQSWAAVAFYVPNEQETDLNLRYQSEPFAAQLPAKVSLAEANILTDVFGQKRAAVWVAGQASALTEDLDKDWQEILVQPLLYATDCLGLLVIGHHYKGDFTPKTLQLAEAVAETIALAMSNARTYVELENYTQELETQNRELDAFAHTVAHDLKNPLTSILGFAQMLQAHRDKLTVERQNTILDRISDSSNKMNNIIQELLLLARVRKQEISLEAVENMGHLVHEACKRLEYIIDQHEPDITIDEEWPVVWGYGSWIEEVWANYISNAIKYGGRPAKIEIGATAQADGMVRFWVKDYGPGISAEDAAKLFVPFTRFDQNAAEGQGLGLSIVQRILEKLDGEVGAESEIGQGSTFWFALPQVEDQTATD